MPVFKRTLSELLFRRFVLKHYASNLLVDMNLEARRETLDYIKANMPDAPYFEKHPALVKYAVEQVSTDGLYLEFGAGRGKSMRWIAPAAWCDRVVRRVFSTFIAGGSMNSKRSRNSSPGRASSTSTLRSR